MLNLINRINRTLTSRGCTREEFRAELNKILTPARRLDETHSGLVQIVRWLDPTGKRWSEPKGEIALAMMKWVETHGLY